MIIVRAGEGAFRQKQALIGSLRGERAPLHPVSFIKACPSLGQYHGHAALMAFILGRRSRGCQRVRACMHVYRRGEGLVCTYAPLWGVRPPAER